MVDAKPTKQGARPAYSPQGLPTPYECPAISFIVGRKAPRPRSIEVQTLSLDHTYRESCQSLYTSLGQGPNLVGWCELRNVMEKLVQPVIGARVGMQELMWECPCGKL